MHRSISQQKSVVLWVLAPAFAVLALGCSSQPATRAPIPQEDAIRAVVQNYLHGLKFNDVPSLRGAFWPDAKLLFVKPDGALGQLSQEDWYRMFASSAGKEEQGELRIASMDVTDNAASVKVIETYPKSVYVDYLNLLRIKDRWTIVNKIYTARPK
ncbi:MAG: nuclear transport factor 2 family protein [Gemmatimonadaceae bacterium]